MNINNDPVWVEVQVKGNVTGAKYFGKFYVKPYLNLGEQSDAERLAQTYTRNMPDSIIKDVLWAVAKLTFHIVKYDADWWKGVQNDVGQGLNLLDSSPVEELARLVGEVQRPKDDETPADTQA